MNRPTLTPRAVCAFSILALLNGVAPAQRDGTATAEPAPLTERAFARLHAELTPKGSAAWQTVPWQIDLLAAAERARRERKPLFLWTMNGHPLGCT